MQKPTKSPKKAHEDALNAARQQRHRDRLVALNLKHVCFSVPEIYTADFRADGKKRAAALVKRAMKAKP